MLNLETRSKKPPEKIIGQFKSYFGSDGLGLKLTSDCADHLTFVGGGGYVTARFCTEDNQTVVGIETREWDFPVKEFARYNL